jgi:hypothetical protein
MPMVATSTHLGTPVRLPTGRLEQVTVTDPAHPLYGRTFAVVTSAGTVGAYGQVTVAYRDDILLKIPVVATSLHPTSERLPSSKLRPIASGNWFVWPENWSHQKSMDQSSL